MTTTMAALRLYIIPGACSLAANIALREAGLPFALSRIDPQSKKTDDGTDFLAITSKGYVPALQLEDGQVLTEGVVVLQYIADRNPSAGLAPSAGTMERYRLQEWLTYINSELHKPFSALYDVVAGAPVRDYSRGRILRQLGWLQAQLDPARYLAGARFSVADAYLFTVLTWAPEAGINLRRWPSVDDYYRRVATRPMVIAAVESES